MGRAGLLREAAYSLYSAYRASSDPGFASEVLEALSSVQARTEKNTHAPSWPSLRASPHARTPGPRLGWNASATSTAFRVLEVRVVEDRDDPMACLALSAEGRGKAARGHRRLSPAGTRPRRPPRGAPRVHRLHRQSRAWCRVLPDPPRRLDRYPWTGRRSPRASRCWFPIVGPRRSSPAGATCFPWSAAPAFPLTTVNRKEVPLTLLRITEGNLVGRGGARAGRPLSLDGYDLNEVAEFAGRATLGKARYRSGRSATGRS